MPSDIWPVMTKISPEDLCLVVVSFSALKAHSFEDGTIDNLSVTLLSDQNEAATFLMQGHL